MRFVAASLVVPVGLLVVALSCGSDPTSGFTDGGVDSGGDGGLSCKAGQTECSAKCVDLKTDPGHCGSCSTTCLGGDLCCNGFCVKSTGCDFAVTGVNPLRGNQSGGDWITLTGAGFTPDMQVYIDDGRAPVRVIDGQTATIQTPPDKVGTYDITLVSSKGTSVTRGIFTYVSAGLKLPWQKKPMAVVRGEHPGIAVMQDGRVLIAGGTKVPDDPTSGLDTAEIYTRNSDSVTPAKNTMSSKRWRNAAVTLLDGRVLVVGAAECTGPACSKADLYDPKTDTFTPVKGLTTQALNFVWGVLLVDGRAMFTSAGASTVDIYDPATDAFTAVPLKVVHRFGQRIVRLRDGRVMIMGGDGCDNTCGTAQKDAEIWDPKTGQFTLTAPMIEGRSQFTAHTLPDGRVMVFGGASSSAGGVNAPMKGIEAWDPKTGQWTKMSYGLSVGRTWQASALVRDGTVLVMGGYTNTGTCDPSSSVDQVDPVAGTVTSFGTLPTANTEWNAVTLLDGSVLGVGGGACGGVALPDIDFLPGEPLPN